VLHAYLCAGLFRAEECAGADGWMLVCRMLVQELLSSQCVMEFDESDARLILCASPCVIGCLVSLLSAVGVVFLHGHAAARSLGWSRVRLSFGPADCQALNRFFLS
jgi:hypothetical protein